MKVKYVFLGEDDKSWVATGIHAEPHEDECAIHILGFEELPIVSAYMTPVDAVMLGMTLIQSAREVTKENE
jgi:hypothetical protein